MQFSKEFRSKLKKAKSLVLPKSIVLAPGGRVFLVGEDASVLLVEPPALFGSFNVERTLHLEGVPVNSIIDMLAKGIEAHVTSDGCLAFQTESSQSSYRSVISPLYRVPTIMMDKTIAKADWQTVVSDIRTLRNGIEFALQAAKGKSETLYTNRIFLSENWKKDQLWICGTDNSVMNLTFCESRNMLNTSRTGNFIFPGKILTKAAKLMATEEQKIILTFFTDYAIITLDGQDIDICIPLLKGDMPDIESLEFRVKKCDKKLKIEDVAKLLPPKELQSLGETVQIELVPKQTAKIKMIHVGGNSMYDTGLEVPEDIEETRLRFKKDQLFSCLSMLSGVFYMRWTGNSPTFVSLSNKEYLTVHATEL